ncbi:tRNA uridine-5-carboxymethylaminomethyl(34) synthesis GTPase MnmE [Salidesulfovibrio brasiliensis]
MLDPGRRKDTIAAVATPQGTGGVGIVRISGAQSRDIALALFQSAAPEFSGPTPYRLHYGRFLDADGNVIDEGLLAYMPGPKSFTGEDVVELNCHGGRAVTAAILESALARGARLADKGEFTLRAFLNGRMDLTQAEAVAELIHAPSRAAMHLARTRLSGALGKRIEELRERLESMRKELCVAVDFPEEDVDCLPPETIAATSAEVRRKLDDLVAAFERTKAWREGALVVLAGLVNAGKSSLMNALVGHDRAIVTDTPGTTRDYLEEPLSLGGMTIRLADTAGLRDAGDAVERAGIERSRDLMEQADLILYVVDASETITDEDVDAAVQLPPNKTIVVLNKYDLPEAQPPAFKVFKRFMFDFVKVSVKSGRNMDKLTAMMEKRLGAGQGQPDPDETVPNARQAQALRRAGEELAGLEADALDGVPHDLLGVRLEAACDALSSITGRIAPDDVLNAVFDSFCIGK